VSASKDGARRKELGIIMNGVTGRMGANQHLVRSILAIRKQGGVRLSDGELIWPELLLVGRNERKLRALAQEHGLERWSTDLDASLASPAHQVYFDAQATRERAPALRAAISAGKHVYCEKPVAEDLATALELARLAFAAGVKNGVVQDKLFLPGLLKLRRLREAGFFGRIIAVRGEFGYWVFEGDWQPSQRPSWNYRKEDGGGIILDMLCHWRYVLDQIVAPVRAVSALGVTHIPERVDEAGRPFRCTGRRRCLRHVRTRGWHRRPDQLLLGSPGSPRRPVNPSDRRYRGQRRRRAPRLLGPAPRQHATARLES